MLKLRSFSTSCIKRNIFDASPLKVLKPLQSYAPTFYTHGDNIKPLYEPSQFYSQLKVKKKKTHTTTFHCVLTHHLHLVKYPASKRTCFYCRALYRTY